jgi:hypothetical protein
MNLRTIADCSTTRQQFSIFAEYKHCGDLRAVSAKFVGDDRGVRFCLVYEEAKDDQSR